MAEKFCLKWNDFHSNLSQTFASSRNIAYLQDVTLVGDDNKQMKVHKLVLSASSQYFSEIFRNNPSPGLVLCMEGIGSAQLTHILDYIYNGEVSLFQEDLDKFLITAKRLKLKGLLETEEETNSCFRADQPRHEKQEEKFTLDDHEISLLNDYNVVPEKFELSNFEKESLVSNDQDDIDAKVNGLFVQLEKGKYQCLKCGKTAPRKDNMVYHVETHIEGLSYPCQICGKVYRSRHSMLNHKYRHNV